MSLFKKRAAPPAQVDETTGERRQLTVLFYDIVGSTSLVAGNDPEGLHAALSQIHDAARAAIHDHGGSLEQVMGDGGMAYFGYPVASEDAALSAISAALGLLAARGDIAGAPNIRIGIATSVVVLPDSASALASGRLGAVGVAPNLAARLESAAPINTVLVGQATYALTHRAVTFEAVEGLQLKGFPDVVRAWCAVALKPVASRFERDRDASSRIVGRTSEIATLTGAWEHAVTTGGTAILIEGEAGIGKSRMLSELARTASDARVVTLQCQPRTSGDALFAIVAMYERAFEAKTDPPLAGAAQATAQRLAVLEDDESLSAHARREAIVTAVVEEFIALCADKPLLLLAEDLHWADEVTLAVLDRLAHEARNHALLVVASAREGSDLGPIKSTFTPLPLGAVGPEDAAALIEMTASAPLPPSTRNWIVARGDGNPLFLSELTAFACQTLSNGGQISDITGADVASLSDLLATRLEGAGVAKRTAQVASVLGREFPYHLLAQVAEGYSKHALDADLQRLVDHGLNDIIANGYSYAFRHALIRDVAYDSQLLRVRQRLHSKIVDLVAHDPSLAESVPDILLAEHCIAATRIDQGCGLLLRVAEDAIRRSALRAPFDMLERVLDLSGQLEAGSVRDLIQLRAITLLGPLVTMLKGPRKAAPLYERGQALYFALPEGQRAAFFPVLWGWWFTASNLIEQGRRSEVLIRDVTPLADPESRLQALHCGWASLFDVGAHDRCLQSISDGLALYDPAVGQRSRYVYGHDAQVCGLGERALSAWLTGQLELSAAAVKSCECCADDTAHLASQLHGLDIASQVAFFRHDLPEIDRILSKMANLSAADAVPAITAKRQIFRGWMTARAGDTGQVDAVQAGLAALHDFGVLEDVPFYADIAADVAAASGAIDAAIGPLGDAIGEARSTGLTYWLPELLRRRAVLTGDVDVLDEGFDVARSQGAHMLSLRNVATRLDLGLAVPPEHRAYLAGAIGQVSDCELRARVVHALGL